MCDDNEEMTRTCINVVPPSAGGGLLQPFCGMAASVGVVDDDFLGRLMNERNKCRQSSSGVSTSRYVSISSLNPEYPICFKIMGKLLLYVASH